MKNLIDLTYLRNVIDFLVIAGIEVIIFLSKTYPAQNTDRHR